MPGDVDIGRVRSGLRRLRARTAGDLRADEAGFTIVEVMVALTIMFVALLSLVYTVTNSFQHIALSRQRQEAHGVADRYLERIRALPYDTVKLGMLTSDLVADTTNVQPVPFGYRLKTTNERIPNGAGVPTVEPLVPNAHTETVGNNTYQVRTYITYFQDDDTTGVLRASVIVTWNESIRDRPGRMVAETVIFSPAGCLSTATHAYSGPCQAQSMVDAAVTAGPLTVNARNLSTGAIIPGGSLAMANSNASMQVEQLSNVNGVGRTSSIALAADDSLGEAAEIASRRQIQTRADNDPAVAGANDYETGTAPTQTASTLTRNAGPLTFRFTSSQGDTAVSTSTVRANAANVCTNNTSAAVQELDQLPCGSNRTLQAAPARAFADVVTPSVAGSVQVAEVRAAPSPSGTFVQRDVTALPGLPCAGTNTRGCVHAAANRTIGQTSLADMPSGFAPPSGWLGYLVRVSGYTDRATAEAGIDAEPPTVSRSGTISYWTGAGYADVTLGASAVTIAPSVRQAIVTGATELYAVEIAANLTIPAVTATGPAATCSGSLACITEARATAPSPLTGTITYTFIDFGQPVLELTVDVNLGESVARATYQDAPSGA